MKKQSPTIDFYRLYDDMFTYYNKSLFGNKIPIPVITITRRPRVMGHYIHNRWTLVSNKKQADEIAINPEYIIQMPLVELCQTLVHEMCHAWQSHFGAPSRKGYHNKEFATIMKRVGLMPSDTGRPGGKETGQSMNDYPIEGGIFIKKTELLFNSHFFKNMFLEVTPKFVDKMEGKPLHEVLGKLSINDINIAEEHKPKRIKSKYKYSCECSNVWGRDGLDLSCNLCGEDFEIQT